VLWCEKEEAVTFLNLEMRPLVRYCTAPAPVDDSAPAPVGIDETSWRLLSQHVADYRERAARSQSGSCVEDPPTPAGIDPEIWRQFTAYLAARRAAKAQPAVTVVIPQRGAPGITPWSDLKSDEHDHLLWLNAGTLDDDNTDQNDASRWQRYASCIRGGRASQYDTILFLGPIHVFLADHRKSPSKMRGSLWDQSPSKGHIALSRRDLHRSGTVWLSRRDFTYSP
jgi:hypothetical protein